MYIPVQIIWVQYSTDIYRIWNSTFAISHFCKYVSACMRQLQLPISFLLTIVLTSLKGKLFFPLHIFKKTNLMDGDRMNGWDINHSPIPIHLFGHWDFIESHTTCPVVMIRCSSCVVFLATNVLSKSINTLFTEWELRWFFSVPSKSRRIVLFSLSLNLVTVFTLQKSLKLGT